MPVKKKTASKRTTGPSPARTRRGTDARRKKDGVAPGESKNTKGKATHELEASNPAKRPSRTSTRGSANRAKPDSQLKRRQTRAIRSPQARVTSKAG